MDNIKKALEAIKDGYPYRVENGVGDYGQPVYYIVVENPEFEHEATTPSQDPHLTITIGE